MSIHRPFSLSFTPIDIDQPCSLGDEEQIYSPSTASSVDSRGRSYSVQSDSDSPPTEKKGKGKLKLSLPAVQATPPEQQFRSLKDICMVERLSPSLTEKRTILEATCSHEKASAEIHSFLEKEKIQFVKDASGEPKLLGRGNFSYVYLVEDAQGVKHALKIFQLNKHKEGSAFKVNHEKGELVTQGLHTERLIRPEKTILYQEEAKEPKLAAILYPYVEGTSLKDLSPSSLPKDHAPPSRQEVMQMAQEMILATKEAHDHHLLHRDIKPENFRRREDGTVILLDFGIAEKGISSTQKSGTELFFSPERFHTPVHSFEADTWSLGLAIHELATGKLPYTQSLDIPRPDAPNLALDLAGYPAPFVEIVSGFLTNNPSQRLTLDQALQILEKAQTAPIGS